MFKSILKTFKFDTLSLTTFLFCALEAVTSHILLFADRPVRDARLFHNLSLGMAYDVMNAAMPAVICLLLCWRLRPSLKITVHGIVVAFYFGFIFTDYIYVQQFGVHLPFSTIEYIKEIDNLFVNIISSLSEKVFWVLFVIPLCLYFLSLRLLYKLSGQKFDVTLRTALSTILLLGVIGGASGSYANSYVGKNLNDPLTSSAALYFYWSKNLEKDRIIAKPEKALKVMSERLKGKRSENPEHRDFPLIRTIASSTCDRPEEQNQAGKALCGANKPNILLIMLESFRSVEVGVYGSAIKITPNFDRLSKEGVLFKNFYANGFQTRNGQAASYCSIMPNYGAAIMKSYAQNNYLCLPKLLNESGYGSSCVFGSDAAFDNQINFLPKIGFDKIYDKFSFDSKAEVLGWGYSDQEMFNKWLEILDKEKEPFFSSALTITNHHPFDVPEQYKLNIAQNGLNKYYESFHYTDAMLGEFIKKAKTKKWHANSLIFVFADTANYQPPQKKPDNFEEFIRIRSQIPLLILGGAVKNPAVIEEYFSQIDLAPTIMDLLGIEYTAPWVGTSMISKKSKGVAFTFRPGTYFAVMSEQGRYYNENNSKDHYYGFSNQELAKKYKLLGKSLISANKWLLQNNLHWPDKEN